MDTLVGAYKSAVLQNYANFSGRLSRPGFWWFVLANIIVWIALSILTQIADLFFILAIGYWLAIIVPSIAATVRRLHDTGKSGWFVLIGLIPFVGGIILLVFCAMEGNPQANEYGPPPGSDTPSIPAAPPAPAAPSTPPPPPPPAV